MKVLRKSLARQYLNPKAFENKITNQKIKSETEMSLKTAASNPQMLLDTN